MPPRSSSGNGFSSGAVDEGSGHGRVQALSSARVAREQGDQDGIVRHDLDEAGDAAYVSSRIY